MNLLDLLPGLKRTATTHGGEYAGPCPFCGGRDRFRAWPDQGPTGRYWCRGCGKHGDGIQYLRDKDGLSFRDACATLGVTPSLTGKPGHRSGQATGTGGAWEPRQATAPGDAWADRAGAFLGACQKNLTEPSGADCRAFLIGRGLSPETIRAAGLGWNMADRYENRDAWGVDQEAREDGKPRRVWLPAGLVIPCFAGGQLVRLRVRRPDPGDGPRYVIIPGSGTEPLTLGMGRTVVVVESELDAFLIHQEAGDLAGVIALGSATTRPDAGTDRTLRTAGLILVALDSDEAGASESWKWWAKHYPNARRWPIPNAKDTGDAWKAGLNLRAWVLAGLPDEPEPEPTTEPAQSAQAPHQEPLQSTQTKKTYQTRGNRFLPLKVLPLRPRATRKRLHRLGHTKTRGPNVAPFLSHFLPSGKHVSTKSS